MMMTTSLIIADPLHLFKETMQRIRTTVLRYTHHPGSRNFHLLRDNCCLCHASLVVSGKYLLDLIMSMGVNGTLSIYIERTNVVLLERNVIRICGRGFQMYLKASIGPSSPISRDCYHDAPQDTG
jgi:hypothetical protein